MSSFYYSREAGAEGQILTGEGTAPGAGLDTLLDRERPPLRAALAIGSALADLLCIASDDRMVHGDIRPAHVKIDSAGTVSLEGYGVQRRTSKAPEGKPESHATDVYGLGVVLHSILSPEPLGNLPKEADAHDDEVVSRVLAMDFRQVQGKRWLEDVRKFLCQILAWNAQDRPAPLDAANVLASVAAQCPGETLEAWAKRVNAAPSRAPAAAPTPVRPAAAEEDLGGPVALSGPLAKGGARQAPAAKGESTAFWSREKIAAMLAEDDDEPPLRQNVSVPKAEPRRSEPQRAEPTFRMEEPARAEPPRRAEPEPPPRRPEPEPTRSRPPEPQRSEPQRPEPQRSQPEPQRSQSSQASSPFANAKIEAADPFEQPEKKTSPMVWVAVVVVVLMLVCGGLTLGGGGLYWFIGTSPSTTAAQEAAEKAAKEAEAKAKEAEAKAKEAAEKATADAGGEDAAGDAGADPKTDTKTETKTDTKATTSVTTTTTTPKTTTTSSKTTTPKTTPNTPKTTTKTTTPKTTTTTTAAPPPSASFSVKFSAPGREGKLQCGDGQTAEFAGATTLSFDTTTTCLVRIDLGKGAVQVSRTASITCSEDAGKVTCSGG